MGLREVVQPTGDLPPSVYWLRRGAVALPVIAVVVIIIVLVSRGSGSGSAAAPGGSSSVVPPTSSTGSFPPTTPTPSTPSTSTPTTPTPSPTSASPSASPTASTPLATTPCPTSALTVTLAPSARSYALGQLVRLTATLRSSTTCTATGTFAVVVTSGSDRLWSSVDCVASRPSTAALTARAPASALRSWNQVRTRPGCKTVVGTKAARAGNYRAVATWDGATSAPVAFRLN